MTDTDKTNLDLSTAERIMREAKTDEDRALALKHHAEGVRNLIQSGLSDPFVQAVEILLKRELGPLSSRQSYFLTQLDAEFKTGAAWRDKYSQEIDRQGEQQAVILSVAQESAARLGKLDERVEAVEASQDALTTVVSDQGERIDEVGGKVDALGNRVDSLENRVGLVETALERLSGEITEMRVGITQIQTWQDDHPPAEEIRRIIEQMRAEQ